MAEMSPIDVLRRYQEYETELAPLLLGLLTLPEASLKTYAFVEEVKSLPPDQASHTGARSGGPGAAAPAGAGPWPGAGDQPAPADRLADGDRERRRAIPWFRAVYVVLSLALFLIVGTLIWHGLEQLYLLLCGTQQNRLGAFSAIIFLTLALAVFDLGKTILEEEVLLHKDIFRHSAIRRTITRFIAAILIAVSIEGLLLLFRDPSARANCSGLRWGDGLRRGLLLALGLYVFLGARAEAALVASSQQTAHSEGLPEASEDAPGPGERDDIPTRGARAGGPRRRQLARRLCQRGRWLSPRRPPGGVHGPGGIDDDEGHQPFEHLHLHGFDQHGRQHHADGAEDGHRQHGPRIESPLRMKVPAEKTLRTAVDPIMMGKATSGFMPSR